MQIVYNDVSLRAVLDRDVHHVMRDATNHILDKLGVEESSIGNYLIHPS
jgi:hypothetical protein